MPAPLASRSTPCSTSDQNGLAGNGSSPWIEAKKKPMLRNTWTGRSGDAPLALISDEVDVG
jgi:hypothetical protein